MMKQVEEFKWLAFMDCTPAISMSKIQICLKSKKKMKREKNERDRGKNGEEIEGKFEEEIGVIERKEGEQE